MTLLPRLLWLFAAVLFIALMAQVSLPLKVGGLAIPVTGQSLAVLVAGYGLGARAGYQAGLLYLLAGALGLPVFAEGASGWRVLGGASAGFLWAFPAAAALAGHFGDRGWRPSFPRGLLVMSLGTGLILLGGMLWLAYLYDWQRAFEWGVAPYLPGALLKVVLGAAVFPLLERWQQR